MRVYDFFVSVPEPSPSDLADAERDLARLRDFDHPTDSRFLADMGRRLWSLAFSTDEINDAFAEALAAVMTGGDKLRLWLRAESSHVAALPWEYLCMNAAALAACQRQGLDISATEQFTRLPNPDTFIALNPNILFVRQAGATLSETVREHIGPLKVLIVWANPNNEHWQDIPDAEKEANSVRQRLETLGAAQVTVDILPAAKKSELEDKLREFRPHVIHFIGHGAFPYRGPHDPGDDPGDVPAPSLVLEGRHTARQRCHDYLTSDELRDLCHACGVRVVILNSCWGGRSDSQLTGVAQALTTPILPNSHTPILVTVAMQCPIPQTTALLVSDWLYRALTTGNSFEIALQQFREDYIASHNIGDRFWGIPVLYAAAQSTVLFERAARPSDVPDDDQIISQLTRDFIGRTFLFEEIRRFLASYPSGIFLLTAPAGVGKSASLAKWASLRGSRARCFYRYSEHDSPLQCARALYAALREKWCPDLPSDPPNELRDTRDKLDALLQEVSRRLPSGEQEVIVIDGLDEAAAANSADAVPLPDSLPPGIFAVIAARPAWLEGHDKPHIFHHYPLDPHGADNLRDAANFVAGQLEYKEVPTDRDRCARLARQVDGNFLILKLVCGLLPAPAAPAQVERIFGDIRSLTDAYHVYFEQLAERISADELGLVDDLLGALAAAAAPVTESQLSAVLNRPPTEIQRALRHIRRFLATAFIPDEAVTYRFFHASFREFVLERVGNALPNCHRLWGEHCANWRDLSGYARIYALDELLDHTRLSEMWEELCDALTDPDYFEAKIDLYNESSDSDAASSVIFWRILPYFHAALKALPADHPMRNLVVQCYDLLTGDTKIVSVLWREE